MSSDEIPSWAMDGARAFAGEAHADCRSYDHDEWCSCEVARLAAALRRARDEGIAFGERFSEAKAEGAREVLERLVEQFQVDFEYHYRIDEHICPDVVETWLCEKLEQFQ